MATQNIYKATEVESILLKEIRSKDLDFYRGEKSIIKTLMENAKRNGRVGDKILLVIPPYYVHVPDWQRKADIKRAKAIGEAYDPYQWEVPKIIYINGKLIVADGMHRILGAAIAEIPNVVVEIVEVSEEEAIELFLKQSENRSRMTPADNFDACLRLNRKDYVEFLNVCNEHKIQIKGRDDLAEYHGIITAILDGVRMDKETLDKILTLIEKLKWNDIKVAALPASKAPWGSKTIRAFKTLYDYYGEREVEMERALMFKCKGIEFFTKHLSGSSQYKMLDTLNDVVEKSLKPAKGLNVKIG